MFDLSLTEVAEPIFVSFFQIAVVADLNMSTTATLTASTDRVDHSRELLQALRYDDRHTIQVSCSDGRCSSSVILLAAVSPLLREVGRHLQGVQCDCEEIHLFLPDYRVFEIQQFLSFLTSTSGPSTLEERRTFAQILRFFGQEIKSEIKQEEIIPNTITTDLDSDGGELQLDSDEEWLPAPEQNPNDPMEDEDEDDDEVITASKKQRTSFKSKLGPILEHSAALLESTRLLEICRKISHNMYSKPCHFSHFRG